LAWTLQISETAKRQLKSLDRSTAKAVLRYLNRLILETENPKQRGKPLTANFAGLWRYRVGDYRVICDVQGGELVVLVLQIAHRREVYR
jgi:mRNA interferase RelE/StbE